jgi:hypothetical protein
MSNLSDLLPAGGGGKQVDFVASGTIGDGVTVALNSNGTVSVVATSGATGSTTAFNSAYTIIGDTGTVIYDTNTNKVVIVWTDYPNRYGFAVVGTVSGMSISFGTPVVWHSSAVFSTATAFDYSSNRFAILYRDANTAELRSIVGTVSGVSITFGTQNTIASNVSSTITLSYSGSANRYVAAYATGGNGQVNVGALSGTNISWNTATTVTGAFGDCVSIYEPTAQKIVFFYRNSSSYLTSIVGTVSSTSVTFGSPVVVLSEYSDYLSAAYDTTTNKVIVSGRNIISGVQSGSSFVGTVSGTAISFGTRAIYTTGTNYYSSTGYDPSLNKIIVIWRDDTNSNYGTYKLGTVSGTDISFGGSVVLITTNTGNPTILYNPDTNTNVVGYTDFSDSNYGKAFIFTPIFSNITDFIGITDAAISDTATGSVTIKGGVSTNVTSLTANTDYYVQADGTLSTTTSSVLAGKALSATSILLKG